MVLLHLYCFIQRYTEYSVASIVCFFTLIMLSASLKAFTFGAFMDTNTRTQQTLPLTPTLRLRLLREGDLVTQSQTDLMELKVCRIPSILLTCQRHKRALLVDEH